MLYYSDPVTELHQGDIRDVVKELAPASCDLVMTSPPFYGQRVYKIPDTIWDANENCRHEWGGNIWQKQGPPGSSKPASMSGSTSWQSQSSFCRLCGAWRGTLGNEPYPDLYIKHLCDIFDLLKPVLKKTATIWVNIADSYGGSGSPGGDFRNGKGGSNYLEPYVHRTQQSKSLIGIPERFVLEMQRRGNIRRSTIIWWKRNCMPESVKDRFTEDFEYLYMFSLQGKYFFERQFEPYENNGEDWGVNRKGEYERQTLFDRTGTGSQNPSDVKRRIIESRSPLGRNMRTLWDIPTSSYGGPHYATYPEKLCETPILAGCPLYICTKCGKPRTKVYKEMSNWQERVAHGALGGALEYGANQQHGKGMSHDLDNSAEFLGYSSCSCGVSFVPGVVLDPFVGTGTTLSVAKRLGRKSIGVELSERYCKLAVKRIEATQSPLGGITDDLL